MIQIPFPLKGLVFLIVCMWLFSSCGVGRRMQSVSTVQKQFKKLVDSAASYDETWSKLEEQSLREKLTRDTAVGVAGNEIVLTEPVGNIDTTIKQGNLSLRVYDDHKGQRRIECKSDSLTIVIRNVTYERDFFRRGYDSVVSTRVFNSRDMDSTSVTLTEVVKTEQKGFFSRLFDWLVYLLAVFGIVFIIILIYRRGRL